MNFRFLVFLLLLPQLYSAQWVNISSNLPTFGGGQVIDACDSNTIVLVAWSEWPNPQPILLSVNGGKNWENITPLKDGEMIVDISIIDKDNIWFVTSNVDSARIFHTADGGNSWDLQFNDSTMTKFLNYIEMFDLNNGIAMGDAIDPYNDPALFLRTNDGGKNWISQNNQFFGGWSGDMWRRLDFVSPSVGYFLASGNPDNDKSLYKTVDDGKTWTQTNFLGGTHVLKFYNENIGLTYRGKYDENMIVSGLFYRTTDGGESWKEFEMEATGWGNDIEFIPGDASQVWFTDYENLFYSSDYGKNWVSMDVVEGDIKGRDIVFVDDEHGWLICEDALYYTNNNGGIVTDISKNQYKVMSKEIYLSQNYPNPFNPSTKIEFSISDIADVNLTVFNSLGERVKTLVNKQLQKGNYSVDFNGSNLASGIYYYKLSSGDNLQTKKMILLK